MVVTITIIILQYVHFTEVLPDTLISSHWKFVRSSAYPSHVRRAVLEELSKCMRISKFQVRNTQVEVFMMAGCVVVTGAASGIGRAISIELNKKGFVVALWDKDKDALQKLCSELEMSFEERATVVDTTNYGVLQEAVSKVEDQLGPINILVNNAGINLGPCLFKNEPRENWLKVVDINMVGMLNVTSLIFPLMAARKSGHVVNISSICGKSVLRNHAVYGAGKYFLEGFSEGLRREGLLDGIKVTVVRPSATRTQMGATSTRDKTSEDFVGMDPESQAVETELLDTLNGRGLPWVMDADEVGKAVAEILTLPKDVVINELTISAIGFPE